MVKKLYFLSMIIIFISVLSCVTYAGTKNIQSYKDIPGITKEEKAAIEAIAANHDVLTYASIHGMEAFVQDGEIKGFLSHICKFLSQLYGIEFVPELVDWNHLIDGIGSGAIDFTGELTPTSERMKSMYMSTPIVERNVKFFRLADSETINSLVNERIIKLGILRGTVFYETLSKNYAGQFVPVYMDNHMQAAEMILNRTIDAFVEEGLAEAYFLDYPQIKSENCQPMIYIPVSMTTGNPELEPIISTFNKYLAGSGFEAIANLYSVAHDDYRAYKFQQSLSPEEKDYISALNENGEKVKVGLESDNYPKSFYNENEKEFQGITVDILAEVSKMSDIEFDIANAKNAPFHELFQMLKLGSISAVGDLVRSDEREESGSFLWSEVPYAYENYVFISKIEFPETDINKIINARVGTINGTVYETVFKTLFSNSKTISYDTYLEAFEALENGDIDLLTGTENALLSQNNYYQNSGYKINNYYGDEIEVRFGFNADEDILKSIMDKAQANINTAQLTKNWSMKIFNYSAEITSMRITMLIVSLSLVLIVLILTIILIIKNRSESKTLEKLVEARTAELHSQTVRLKTIYRSIPDLVFCKGIDSKYTSCNPAFERFAGMTEAELTGKSDYDIFASDKARAERFLEKDRHVIDNKTLICNEESFMFPDGSERLYEFIKTPLIHDSEVIGIMGILRDITERKSGEIALKSAAKAKGDFLARMSHEIRTPLNAIIGMAHINKNSIGDKEKSLQSINQIIIASNHLLGILNDILDMSKIESGKLVLTNEAFRLEKAFDEINAIITHNCNAKKISFQTNIHELKDMALIGDKLRLNQVLVNLLSNAIKFTLTCGKVRFLVNILDETKEYVKLGFVIEDSGIGMNQAQVETLFLPFEQASPNIAAQFGGTGLGLAISQNIVQSMGGKISVTSKENIGSVFTFELMFQKTDSIAETTDENNDNLDFSGKTILLAEDVAINCEVICSLLEDTHIQIECVENGRQALEKFKLSEENYYDLIFMDIQMPLMDGYQATKQIRRLERSDAKTVPIIAMTANAYSEDIKEALSSGMNGHIAKPIDIDEMFNVLKKELYSR